MVVGIHPTHIPGGTHMNCDCDATPEERQADIHAPNCTSHESAPDDPSDHYGQ